MAYIPLRKAVEFLGLSPNTLRKYADEGKFKGLRSLLDRVLYLLAFVSKKVSEQA